MMCALADALHQPLDYVRDMPLTDYHMWLGYFKIKSDKEKAALKDAKRKQPPKRGAGFNKANSKKYMGSGK